MIRCGWLCIRIIGIYVATNQMHIVSLDAFTRGLIDIQHRLIVGNIKHLFQCDLLLANNSGPRHVDKNYKYFFNNMHGNDS